MVLNTLSRSEMDARRRALEGALVRDAEDRVRAAEEAKRRAEEDARRAKEREESARRQAEEEARIKAEAEAKARAEAEAAKRAPQTEARTERRDDARPAPQGGRPQHSGRPQQGGRPGQGQGGDGVRHRQRLPTLFQQPINLCLRASSASRAVPSMTMIVVVQLATSQHSSKA